VKELPDNWMYLEAFVEHPKSSYRSHIHAGIVCPACGVLKLHLRSMPDFGETYWYCPTCGDWKTPDLDNALDELESDIPDQFGYIEDEVKEEVS
jgi:phage terminase large subunit GpA-like protein